MDPNVYPRFTSWPRKINPYLFRNGPSYFEASSYSFRMQDKSCPRIIPGATWSAVYVSSDAPKHTAQYLTIRSNSQH